MPALFVLEVETDAEAGAARLRLLGSEGEPLGEHRVELAAHPPARWEGLFDTRRYVRRMARDPRQIDVLLDAVGGFLGRAVLGPEITRALAAGEQRRGLLVRLAGAAADPLAAAFARVPWELARVEGDLRTLQQRNVLVRVTVEDAVAAPWAAAEVDEPIRALLVFAGPAGARPAGARQEREDLLDALFHDVLPHRDVEVDVLCHGVTRARLWEQVRRRGGYHLVHWSGHAQGDALEIALDEGEEEEPLVTGAELADLFSGAGAGETLPRLFFLSASRAGSIGSATDWASLRAALRPVAARDEPAPGMDRLLEGQEGATTSVGLALIGAGVPEVVAVRHEVGPAYARALARRFYRSLFAGEPADSALASAWRELAEEGPFPAGGAPIAPEDHGAALVLGAAAGRFEPAPRPSAQAGRRAPRSLLASGSKDLDPGPGFLGRGAELAQLARRWLAPDGAPVALLEGPPGAGKTALAAEAIYLWHRDFDHVFAVQTYGWPLPPGVLLHHIARRLAAAVPAAHHGEPFGRPRSIDGDLAEALAGQRVLIVIDGLAADPGDVTAPTAWGRTLDTLGERLRGGGSRVLATSRRLADASAPDRILRLSVGPLPLNEAALLADRCGPLRELLRGDEEAEELARRVLEVSHGQPMVLLRLGDLAGLRGDGIAPLSGPAAAPATRAGPHRRPTGRAALERGIERLARRLDAGLLDAGLPLEELAADVVDLLLEHVSPGARRLLWGITLAGEPVKAWMVEELGAMLLTPDERLRPALEELLAAGLLSRDAEDARGTAYGFHALVAERAGAWMARAPEERGGASVEDVWRSYGERYSAAFRNALPMLQQGLLAATPGADPSSKPSSSDFSRDPRSRPASSRDPADARSRPVSATQLFEPRSRPPAPSSPDPRGLISVFEARPPTSLRRPHELAAELGRRAVRYLVRARAFKALSAFAAAAVSMVADAALLAEVIADLAAAADSARDEARWRTRIALADALRSARRLADALPLYTRGEAEAEAAAHWGDVGVIRGKWADALALAERFDEARAMYERSAEAKRRAGRARVSVVAAELEALRMDVARGAAEAALPAIEGHLERLRGYWDRRQGGEELREAPNDAVLADTLAAALDVARRANAALERWEPCLELLAELERLGRTIGAADHYRTHVRFYRVTPLIRLGRFDEATAQLEFCIEGFRRARDLRGEARALSALANVYAELGDPPAAAALEYEALAVRERSAGPAERAFSHARLAGLLHRAGQPGEAAEHGLAAAAYQLASGHDPHPELRDLAARVGRAGAGEGAPAPRLLRLAALLERPAFLTLRRSLGERGVPIDALQARLDDLFARAVAASEGERRASADPDEDRLRADLTGADPGAERGAAAGEGPGRRAPLPIKGVG